MFRYATDAMYNATAKYTSDSSTARSARTASQSFNSFVRNSVNVLRTDAPNYEDRSKDVPDNSSREKETR